MKAQGVVAPSMDEFMKDLKSATPPHAGAGIGLKRIVMIMLQMGNIRFASIFHGDPKSLPAKLQLRHPADSTLNASREGSACQDRSKMLPLEHVIAKYGDLQTPPG